jgi:hypothetical protein
MSALGVVLPQDPAFGYDPWLNPATDPQQIAAEHQASLAAGKLYTGEDAIGGDLGLFDLVRDYYASYVDNYGGWGELETWAKAHAPHAFLLSYTIFGNPALCADVEPGAMHNGDFPGWLDHTAWKDAQGNSWGYTSSGNMGALIDAAGGRRFIRIGAHYGHGAHICGPGTCGYPQCDWTQWNDVGAHGQNVDQLIGTYLPGAPKPPAAPWQPDIERYLCHCWDHEPMSAARRARFRAQMIARALLIKGLVYKTPKHDWDYRHRGERFHALWTRARSA